MRAREASSNFLISGKGDSGSVTMERVMSILPTWLYHGVRKQRHAAQRRGDTYIDSKNCKERVPASNHVYSFLDLEVDIWIKSRTRSQSAYELVISLF